MKERSEETLRTSKGEEHSYDEAFTSHKQEKERCAICASLSFSYFSDFSVQENQFFCAKISCLSHLPGGWKDLRGSQLCLLNCWEVEKIWKKEWNACDVEKLPAFFGFWGAFG